MSDLDEDPFNPTPGKPKTPSSNPFDAAPEERYKPAVPPHFSQSHTQPPIFKPGNEGGPPRTGLKIAITMVILGVMLGGGYWGAQRLVRYVNTLELSELDSEAKKDYWQEAQNELAKPKEERNYEKVYEYLVASARAGNNEAATAIGVKYDRGVYLYTEPDTHEAWFLKAAAAGSVWAQYVLGYRYMTGAEFPKNFKEAERFLKLAAEGGNGEAALYLGGLYFHPKYGFGRKELAFPWFLKAGQAGIKEGQYLTSIGYGEGWAGKSDGAKAKYWTTLALEDDDEKALGTIAYLYYGDLFIPQDFNKAAAWYKQAAKNNSPQALYDLASLYETGQGVGQDYEEALSLYRRSAMQGFKPAIYALGHIYRYGTFGSTDLDLAAEWLEKGAQLDHPGSTYMLGRMVEQGLGGGEPDVQRALSLYDRSCQGGERIGCAYAAILRQNESLEGDGKGQLELVEAYYSHHCNVREEANSCYNFACILALLGRKGEALTALEQAFRFGYDELKHMAVDEDLDSLRQEPRFLRLTTQ